MSFCVVRCEKVKTMAHLGKAHAHNHRTSAVPNAAPQLRSKNEVLVDCRNVTEAWKAKVGNQKYRSDAVLGIQVTLIRSPDWAGDEKQWTKLSQEWLEKEFGRSNVLSSVVHRDEQTPHLQALVVPLKNGKLNAKSWLGGAAKLAQLQTSYAKQMAPLGLVRGEEWSQATHGDIHEHYAAIKEASRGVPEQPKPNLLGIVPKAEVERVYTAAVSAQKRASQAERERDGALKRVKTAEAKLAQAKERTDLLREIPLEKVIERLGAERDKTDKQKWILPSGEVVALEQGGLRFHLVQSGGGGRGAIDLVKKGIEGTFMEAVSWLAQEFGQQMAAGELRANEVDKIVSTSVKAHPTAGIPKAEPKRWEVVREYLVKVRNLAGELVDKLHAAGKVYADAFANAVFAHQGPSGELGGVELRGTGGKRFVGARGAKLGFLVEGSKPGLVVVESAIDAISCVQLTGKSAVSTGGANMGIMLSWFDWAKTKGIEVFAGQDRDDAGREMAELLEKMGATRIIPLGAKDWNEALDWQAKTEERSRIVRQQMREREEPAKGKGMGFGR